MKTGKEVNEKWKLLDKTKQERQEGDGKDRKVREQNVGKNGKFRRRVKEKKIKWIGEYEEIRM